MNIHHKINAKATLLNFHNAGPLNLKEMKISVIRNNRQIDSFQDVKEKRDANIRLTTVGNNQWFYHTKGLEFAPIIYPIRFKS